MSPEKKGGSSRLATNRRALHDYEVLERIEAGIALQGTEVKSIRAGHCNLSGAYVRAAGGRAELIGMTVEAYEHGNRFNHVADRSRRLLLHKREILMLGIQTDQKGRALIPLAVYLKRGKVKVEIGVCSGKRQADKRETLKRATAKREADRAIRDAAKRG